MIPWLQTKALSILLAAIPLGLLASMAYQFLKKLIERETTLLEKTPAWMHRFYFTAVATLITTGAAALGITVDCTQAIEGASCLSVIQQDQLKIAMEVILAAVVGLLAHVGKKKVGA